MDTGCVFFIMLKKKKTCTRARVGSCPHHHAQLSAQFFIACCCWVFFFFFFFFFLNAPLTYNMYMCCWKLSLSPISLSLSRSFFITSLSLSLFPFFLSLPLSSSSPPPSLSLPLSLSQVEEDTKPATKSVLQRGLVVDNPSSKDILREHRRYLAIAAEEAVFEGASLVYVTPVCNPVKFVHKLLKYNILAFFNLTPEI